MTLFSRHRFHRVRSWHPGVGGLIAQDVVSPPYVLERPHVRNGFQARLHPVGEEWWRDRVGHWHEVRWLDAAARAINAAKDGVTIFPALLPRKARKALRYAFGLAPMWVGDPGVSLASMLGFYSDKLNPKFYGTVGLNTTDTTQLLDAAMNFGVSGDAFAIGFTAPAAKTIESLYAYVTAVGGTFSGAIRLRGRASGLPTNPAIAAATGKTATAVGWNEFGGISSALTYGTQYYMSIEDGAASTADITVQTDNTRLQSGVFNIAALSRSLFWRTISTNGYSTQSTATNATGIVTFSDGTAMGNPIASSAQQSEAQKGLYWIGGPTEDLDVYGVEWSDAAAASAFTAGQIWSGTNGPTGSPDVDSSAISLLNEANNGLFGWAVSTSTPVRIVGGTDYRFIHQDNAAFSTGPRKYSIGAVQSGTVADLKLCLPYGGNWQWTDETGSAWADDSEGFPGLALLIADQVAIAAGGGGNANILGGSVIQ